MPRFYFNHQDGDLSYPDEDGFEFPSAEVARLKATEAMGEAARDELPGHDRRELSIEVLDENRRPLFRATFRFEVQDLVFR
jgi:hypothetical protein